MHWYWPWMSDPRHLTLKVVDISRKVPRIEPHHTPTVSCEYSNSGPFVAVRAAQAFITIKAYTIYNSL